MEVTYINHSSFLLEGESNLFLFDYFDGDMPPLNDTKPLYCFASHSHGDHFSEKLFEVTASHPNVHYILSDDIFKSRVPDQFFSKCDFVSPYQTMVIDNISIKTLKSTDLGVAFIIEEEGRLIYHGGDLNNWQWQEESPIYNTQVELDYLAELDKMKGASLYIAFLPFDSRQEEYVRLKAVRQFFERVNAQYIFPMHLWDEYTITDSLTSALNHKTNSIFCCSDHRGQKFVLAED